MRKIVVDTLSLLETKIAKNQPLNCAAAAEPNEVIAPNVRELLIDREHDVAGFVIPLTLEEVSPWHIRLRHGDKVLPYSLRSLPSFVQWVVLNKSENVVIFRSLKGMDIGDLQWLIDSIHGIHAACGIKHFVIESASFPLSHWSGLFSRTSEEINFSVTNTVPERYTLNTIQQIELLIRRYPRLRWLVNLESLCESLEQGSRLRLPYELRRILGSVSGVYSPVGDSCTAMLTFPDESSQFSLRRRVEDTIGTRLPLMLAATGSSTDLMQTLRVLQWVRDQAEKQQWLEVA